MSCAETVPNHKKAQNFVLTKTAYLSLQSPSASKSTHGTQTICKSLFLEPSLSITVSPQLWCTQNPNSLPWSFSIQVQQFWMNRIVRSRVWSSVSPNNCLLQSVPEGRRWPWCLGLRADGVFTDTPKLNPFQSFRTPCLSIASFSEANKNTLYWENSDAKKPAPQAQEGP